MSELHDEEIEVIDFEPVTETKRGFSYRFRWLHVFVACFGSAALISAWFVLTAKSVLVEVNPITAQIKIDNGFALRVGARYLMRTGEYTVVLSNPGFHDEIAPLVINDDAAQTHSFDMRKLPGIVSINALPDGGRVRIDGVDVGDAPLIDIDVEPGLHEISVTRERYLPVTQTIDIEGRRQQQAVELTLEPAWATVSFTTTPSGAELLVDGESMGTTPLNAEILQGRREVMLKLAGYKAWQERLDLDAGTSLLIPRVELEPADGLVFIKSQPSGASVTIGGEFKGQTPLEVALAPDVNHVITFFKNGYSSKDTRLTTRANESREIEIELTPVLSDVTIASTPNDAELFIDGISRGPANQTLALMAISQRVEIRKEGYVPYEAEFTPRPGLQQEIRVNLTSLEDARIAAIKPVITNPAGQQMKLFNPDRFSMGASRREAGRRPNETIRDIVLERPFYLSLTEVTNAQYRQFDSEHNSGTTNGMTLNNEGQPVVRITWQQAADFCNWLSEQEGLTPFYTQSGIDATSNGYRLPTEAEWAWAARRDTEDSTGMRKYSWDGELPPPDGAGNFADVSARAFLGDILFDYNDRSPVTTAVGSYSADHHGLFDMAGNVAEWVNDYYGASGSLGVERDPLGPDSGQFRVIRGSSWAHGTITELRLSFRDFGEEARDDVGFRVARYLDE